MPCSVQAQFLADRLDRLDGAAEQRRHVPLEARSQPPCSGGAERRVGDLQPAVGRRRVHDQRMARVRAQLQPVAEPRAGVAHARPQRPRAEHRVGVPHELGGAREHRYRGALLVQQHRAVERRLAGAEHRDTQAAPLRWIRLVEAMHDAIGGQPAQLGRQVGVTLQAARNHDTARAQRLAVVEVELEARAARAYAAHAPAAQSWGEARLERVPVAFEGVKRHRHADVAVLDALLGAETRERALAARVGQVGGKALRLQAHAAWHVPAPGVHRLAEDLVGDAAGTQVRGDRQPVWPGADHDDVGVQAGAPIATRARLV